MESTRGQGKERTLTAVRSPFADGETKSVPLLLLVGSARAAAPLRRWWILPSAASLTAEPLAVIGRAGGPLDRDEKAAVPAVAVLLADPLISGQHARLVARNGAVSIEDLGSKNGTYVDGQKVLTPAPLTEGTVIWVGEHALLFRVVSPHALLALEAEAAAPLGPVATAAPELAVLSQKLRRWAVAGQDLLLCGETGVGKEIYARAVHTAGERRGPFVPVNCAALPRELVESELFGYRAGAHSTARADKAGLIERAADGTLFLDEIGELPPEGQAKLLRFLQDRELLALGGQRSRRIELVVIAATNQPVGISAADGGGVGGSLRGDLLARLGAAPVALPPLRDRREDLGVLCRHFLHRCGWTETQPAFDGPAFRALSLHPFPLNVRELEKILNAAFALTQGERPIALRDLPLTLTVVSGGGQGGPTRESLLESSSSGADTAVSLLPGSRRPAAPGPSADELSGLLATHQGNVAEVARALGRQRAAIWRWIKQFGLNVEQHRPPGTRADQDDEPDPRR